MTSTYVAIPTFLADGLVKMPDLNYGYSKNLGLHNGLWLAAQAYGGFVIQPMTIQMPALPVAGGGLSPATKTYVLNQLTPHDELSAWTYGSGVLPQSPSSSTIQRQVKIPYASMQLHPGATLITSVHSACASDVTVIGTILPNRQLQVTKVTP